MCASLEGLPPPHISPATPNTTPGQRFRPDLRRQHRQSVKLIDPIPLLPPVLHNGAIAIASRFFDLYQTLCSYSMLGPSPPPPAFSIHVEPSAGVAMTNGREGQWMEIRLRWKKREAWLTVQRTLVPVEMPVVTTTAIEKKRVNL